MLTIGLEYTEITPEENVPLIGYGDRTHNSTGIHDPLYAYIWYVKSESNKPMAWVVTDLCLFNVSTINTMRSIISDKTGLNEDSIVIQATHTHSGPDTYNIAEDTSSWAKNYFKLLTAKISAGIEAAKENSFTGKIEVREGRCSLGVNRRKAGGITDPRIIVLTLRDSLGKERGTIFHYSCHLTVLGVENYLVSSDWVGPARNRIQAITGAPACFIQGAEGNIDPLYRGVLDMADPDQAKGSSFSKVEKAGEMMADAVMMAKNSSPLSIVSQFDFTTVSLDLPLRYGPLTKEQIEEKLNEWKKRFAEFLDIPQEDVTEKPVINALIKEQCRKLKLSAAQTRKIVAEQFTYIQFIWAYKLGSEFIDSQKGTLTCKISGINFGTLTFLGIPAEVLIESALEFQEKNKGKTSLISGLFNGSFGYMPHVSNFKESNSDSLYETISTLFGENTSEIILSAAMKT